MFACAGFLLSSFSIREHPQDPPRGKKKERHIKLEKIDEKGKKTELDTVIKGDGVFVWNGDTISDGKDMKWITKGDFKLDSLLGNLDMNFDFNFDETDSGNVFVWHGKNGPRHLIVPLPPPGVPPVPQLIFRDKKQADNVIDLSDPGIISFKKKEMRDGREKITIVREKSNDNDREKEEEIIVTGVGDAAMLSPKAPVKAHTIKVIKKDGEPAQVIKDGEVIHLDGGDENVKVIKKDGKIIRITENKKGDEKQVEVNVKVETEKENN